MFYIVNPDVINIQTGRELSLGIRCPRPRTTHGQIRDDIHHLIGHIFTLISVHDSPIYVPVDSATLPTNAVCVKPIGIAECRVSIG